MKLRATQIETLLAVDMLSNEQGWLRTDRLAAHLGITLQSAERRLRRLACGPGFPPLECLYATSNSSPEINVYRLTKKGRKALEAVSTDAA